MSSNFDFLQPGWKNLHTDAMETEKNAFIAPRTSVFYARRTLELAIKWMYRNDSDLKPPYQKTLAAMIHEQTFKDNLPSGLFQRIRIIQKIGNMAVHSDRKLAEHDCLQVTKSLHAFLGWLAKTYSEEIPSIPVFDESFIPEASTEVTEDKNSAQLTELLEKLKSKDDELYAQEKRLITSKEGYEAEIEKLKLHIAEIKDINLQKITHEDYSEDETRTLFIDLMLRESGWDPDAKNVREYPVEGMPFGTGEGFVDYVLWGNDGLPLAVVEAKRTTKSPKAGKQQAKLYADCLEAMTGQRPIIYYTNGYETWLWDDSEYPPRYIQGFYTKEQLQLAINRRKTRKDVSKATVNREIVDRYYHEEAVRRIMEAYSEKSRKALVVMATGSGKTRLSIAAVEILMKANWVRRVLFLADRNALVRQAKNAFNAHLPHASLVNLVEEKEDDTSRIVFSTYPTMMNSIDEAKKDGLKRFGVGHFDLIIIDEAHRSVYQKYRAIFEYFDSMLLGLTATPKAEVDKNTYHLFDLENNVPTYAYELEKAVADDYLVPPKAVSVPLKFQREGVKYDELSEEEKEEYEEKFWDEETESIPAEIGSEAINKWLFNTDTVDKVLKHLMEYGLKVEGGDRLGKTIIFAKNHLHAEFIVERFDKNYPKLKGHFCRVIDHQVNHAQSLIDDFYVAGKDPIVVISVDMMDTGIDVPEIVNLVFFKLVRSKTKFWQMVGRGTRLREDLFGPGQDKEFFYIFDYCQNLEFFSENPEGVEAPLQESVKQKIFKRRLTIAAQVQGTPEAEGSLKEYRTELLDQMHVTVSAMNVDNFIVRPKRKYVDKFKDREEWNSLSKSEQVDILEHLTPLPTMDYEDDEFARRFDLLALNLQLCVLEEDKKQILYQERVRELASALEDKKAIPSVAQQMELLLELQTDEYWEDITLPMLERVRKKLRNLIKFLDKGEPQENVYTDFQDELGAAEEVEDLITRDPSLRNYRLKVETFLKEHQDHITIRRLRNNEPITDADLQALETILFSEEGPGTREMFEEVYGTDRPLGVFVRNIVGLDRGAAKEAFSDFLAKMPLAGKQIAFINMIIDHLTLNGVMDPEVLFEPPFTHVHGHGLTGLFPDIAENVVAIIQQVNENAMVPSL